MKTLTIKLAGPLQAYGNEASFERRTTGDYPSKSAVIGMLAAALGYERGDQRILVLNDLRFAVRIDQVGKMLTDFQTVEWKKDMRKITYRDYLQDAVFVVAIGTEDEGLMTQIKTALSHPHFQLFLGRRSNVPAGLLKVQEHTDDPVSILQTLPWQAAKWYQKRQRQSEQTVEIIADADLLPRKRSRMVKDKVISFDQRDRRYGFRAVATERVSLKNEYFTENGTQHDIMDFL
ncbi:type I-E CRISPR-associated protein Cas5/CasD [Lactiplantibacillus carotarum]|uniref:type I-E CRISPR-associated protein Cas5/CasD n=1 Tax=Lactiplantibacillus carotarum TaxID=2993456 RepID=UPI00298ED526|nr:type I-E CRISPR-associated protein Cas5/CasD [Lactiplantibacillus carotarum]